MLANLLCSKNNEQRNFSFNRIKKLLRKYGYAVSDGYHDCGAIGGLAQHRKRYLLIARHEKKVPAFVYHPPVKPMQTIGDVIGTLPLPDDPFGGKMHKLPRLQEKTWQRLAFIRPGYDWRDLQQAPKELQLGCKPRSGTYGIIRWNEPAPTVTGSASIYCGDCSSCRSTQSGNEQGRIDSREGRNLA